MKYNELKYLTAHNAYAAPKYGYQLIDPLLTNQKKSVTDQLNCGVRGLMLDIYWDGSEKVVCAHGSSTIIAHVDLTEILDEISGFLRCNGREIVTIFFEDYLSDHYRELADALQATGYWFDFSAYDVPRNGWPEVETMLANGHRIVAFLEKTTDRESMNLPYLYDYAVETVYGDDSLDHNSWVKKRDQSSILSGGSGKLRREDTLAIVNHFKTVPAWRASDYEGNINNEKNLIGHIDDFYDEHGRTPNTIATDFIGAGSQQQALEHLNRIKPDFVDTKHSGWLVGNSVDWDSQASFQIPDGRKLVGVRVYNEPGYGPIDVAFCHAPADALDDTHERECGTPIFGLFDKGQEYAAYAPPGMAIDGLTVAKHERYGLVNLKIHFGLKGSGWLTKNEGSDAEMVREGPRAGTAIRKIAVRSEGGYGLVDLNYYWSRAVSSRKPGAGRRRRHLPRLAGATLLIALAAPPAGATSDCDGDSGTGSSFVCGEANSATGTLSTAVGIVNTASGYHSTAVGFANLASGDSATAVGAHSSAEGLWSTAIGLQSKVQAGADSAVALGAGSVATEDYTVSVGGGAVKRRIVNVAAGTDATDAVNKSQLDAVANTANNALSVAGAAQSTANNALSAAATADGKAVAAQATANNALSAAATADGKAVAAQATADTARSEAAAAQGTANTALSVAGTAQATADTARSEAAVAQGTADNALSAAATADGKAVAAQGTANTALSAAGTAQATADTARSEAAVAHSVATGAYSVATGAQNTADTALAALQSTLNQMLEAGLCTISGASVACGTNLQLAGGAVAAGAEDGIAIGQGAEVQSSGGIAMGRDATAVQSNSVAIGAGAHAHSSVAVGTGALAIGTNTTAVGDNTVASGEHAVAIGNEARAVHDNAVAIGNGSVTAAPDSMSVGAPGSERRITHVAPGVLATDAANVEQLGQVAARIDQQVGEVRRMAARGVASAMATAPQLALAPGESGIGVGMGHYDGQSAIGVTVGHATRSGVQLNLGVGYAGAGRPALRAGLGWKW